MLEWSFCPAGLHHWWTICSHFLAPRLSILSKLVDRDSYHLVEEEGVTPSHGVHDSWVGLVDHSGHVDGSGFANGSAGDCVVGFGWG